MKVHPYLNFDSKAEEAFMFYKSVFGGDFTANMKMEDTFWGDYMGSFTDKFGIKWMINVAGKLK